MLKHKKLGFYWVIRNKKESKTIAQITLNGIYLTKDLKLYGACDTCRGPIYIDDSPKDSANQLVQFLRWGLRYYQYRQRDLNSNHHQKNS